MAETTNMPAPMAAPAPAVGRSSVSTEGRPSHDLSSRLSGRAPHGAAVDGSLEWYSPEFASLSAEQQSLPRTTAFMILRNAGSKSLIFKVKTTNPKVFRVQPKDGYLKAGETQEIQISIIDKPKTSRFRVVYMHDLPRHELKGATISDYITNLEKEASEDHPVPFVPFNYTLDQDGHAALMPGSVSRSKARGPAEDSVLSSAGETAVHSDATSPPTVASTIDSRPQSFIPSGASAAVTTLKVEQSDDGLRQRSVQAQAEQSPSAKAVSSNNAGALGGATSKAVKASPGAEVGRGMNVALVDGVVARAQTQEVPLRMAALLCLISFLIGYFL